MSHNITLQSLIPSLGVSVDDSSGVESSGEGIPIKIPLYESGYEGTIDYRIRQLSHSSRETLVTCPRKFQLNRLRSVHKTEVDPLTNITFAYGHIVGDGIQRVLQGQSDSQIYIAEFLSWHADLFDEDEKKNKSFWSAIVAIGKFRELLNRAPFNEYELVYYNGQPACELNFCINFPDGFRYRGSVDAVLRHKKTGKIIVLENKTTGFDKVNPSTYKNSAQAIGYSIVLDHLFPDLSDYEVLYLVYTTKSMEFIPIPFVKSYLQRALWIQELLLDIETIKLYEASEVYPMRGQHCVEFYRDCEFINTCTLSTNYLAKEASEDDFDKTEYMVNISLVDLLETQLSKTAS